MLLQLPISLSMAEEAPRPGSSDTFRPEVPGTPDELATAYGIRDEDRDNPLVQAFLEHRAQRVSATPGEAERPAFHPITPTSPENIVKRLGIPEANREHPVVQEFTHIAAALDTLVDQTLNASTAHERPTRETPLARERELLSASDMSRTLRRA